VPVLVSWHREPIRHAFVEIRDARRGGRVVTVIEIVSPSNKSRGPDREAYLQKQAEVLESDAHLLEIDLLRAGERLAASPGLRAYLGGESGRLHYLVHVSSVPERRLPAPVSQVYGFTVRDSLPRVPVPLLAGDAPVPLDLPGAFARTYDAGPFAKIVDYDAEPSPPLDPEDAGWARELLAARR